MRRFIPFLLGLFVIAAFLRVDFFFTVVYLVFGVYLLGRVWTQHTLKKVRFRRRFVNRAFPGDRVRVNVTAHNGSWLPAPWIEVHESLPVQLHVPPFHNEVISIGSREDRHLTYTLTCRRRGYYRIGPLTLRTGDLLGIEPPSTGHVGVEHLVIYPRIVSLQQLGLPTHSPLVALDARSPLFEDPSRIMGVRDYKRGDSPRRIHWRATASTGRLLVKRYQPSIARETLVCLDLNQEDYGERQRHTATELAIVTAASIAHHIIIHEKLPVGLITEADDPFSENLPVQFYLPPRARRAHLMSVLEVLARVKTTATPPFVDLIRHNSGDFSWGATLVVITGRISEPLLDGLVLLRQAGFAVALILVQPSHLPTDLQQRTSAFDVPIHRVWSERDLETWQ